jgi:hypothetical protein
MLPGAAECGNAMPDEMSQLLRRVDTIERNHSDAAKSITKIVGEINEMRPPVDQMRIDREVRKERDKNLNERLDRIEASIRSVYNLGKWVLTAIAASLVTAFVTFLVNGGFSVGH